MIRVMSARNVAALGPASSKLVKKKVQKARSSKKLAISLEGTLAARVRRAAKVQAAGNVSAWLAEAARDRLRLEAGQQLLKEYEATHGALTPAELAEAERLWPRG